jgi:DNA (cytosine-5)-methyltransferase 1
MSTFTYVSCFSGVGGFEQALNKLGGTCVMASEIDKYANQAYEILYGHPTVGDVTKVAAEDVPDHDLLVGGFPCQAFSVAGKRLGFEEARGTLFFEIARIAKVKQPKAMLLENVKGLVGHDSGKTLDTIIQTLAEIGYTVDFEVLNSKYFGVPQNRERIFIVAVRDDLVTPQAWDVGKHSDVVAKGKRRIKELGVKTFNFDWPAQEEVTVRLRDILESDVDEKFYLSEEKTAKLVAQLEEKDKVVGSVGHHPFSKKFEFSGYNSDVSPTLLATDYKAPKTLLESSDPIVYGNLNHYGNDQMNRVYSTEGVSPTITVVSGGGREATTKGYAVATEGDAVNFQFPDSKTQRGRIGKQIANTLEASGINQGVVEAEIQSIGNVNPSGNGMNGQVYDIDAGLSPTLTTNKGEGPKVADLPRYRIRKLTVAECFRLQGFPDDVWQRLSAAGISNSQGYKQAGNAVTVNVIDAIGKRLVTYLND